MKSFKSYLESYKTTILIIIIFLLFIELLKSCMFNNEVSEKNETFKNENDIFLNEKIRKHNEKILSKDKELNERMEKIDSIHFATKDYSFDIFTNSNYLENMNIINIKARNLKKDNYKKKYLEDSLSDISDNEKEAFNWLVESILKGLDKESPLYKFINKLVYSENSRFTVYFAKSKPWLEYNMPHTHKNIVILNNDWYSDLVLKYKDNIEKSAIINEGSTLIHELLHVQQRINIKKFDRLFHNMGFIKAKYIHNVMDLSMRNRCNPDGIDFNWVWFDKENNKYYLFGAIFNSENPKNLIDVSYQIVELQKLDNRIFSYSSNSNNNYNTLTANESFNNYFGITNNHYHPNEIASQYLEYYLEEELYGENYLDVPGYTIFKKNIKSIL